MENTEGEALRGGIQCPKQTLRGASLVLFSPYCQTGSVRSWQEKNLRGFRVAALWRRLESGSPRCPLKIKVNQRLGPLGCLCIGRGYEDSRVTVLGSEGTPGPAEAKKPRWPKL